MYYQSCTRLCTVRAVQCRFLFYYSLLWNSLPQEIKMTSLTSSWKIKCTDIPFLHHNFYYKAAWNTNSGTELNYWLCRHSVVSLLLILQLIDSFVVLQIVATYAFNKTKYADDPDCDVDFETMRSVLVFFLCEYLWNLGCHVHCVFFLAFLFTVFYYTYCYDTFGCGCVTGRASNMYVFCPNSPQFFLLL